MVSQQACKLASSMATMSCKLASSMMNMHQQASNDHVTKTLNPAAKPFVPLHKNNYSIPSSLPSNNVLYAATPLHHPHIYQPYVQHCYQPCLIQHQPQPQPQYYAANFYSTSSFVAPMFFGPAAPCSMLDTNCHSSTFGTPSLKANILNQIEYYFSDENLKHDGYLISLMDDKGWIPISTIANFNRVKAMCKSIPFILDSLVNSTTVEVEGDKIRRRDEWSKWISSAIISKHKKKAPHVEQQPGIEIVPQETISVGNNNTSEVSEKIATTSLSSWAAQQGQVESANNESFDKIELIETVLEGQSEACVECNKTIVANSVLPEPTAVTPVNRQGQEETVTPSPPLSYWHDMEEGKEHLESSSPKYFEKAQSSRSLLDVEFVRAYLAKGDEVFDDDRFSEFRPEVQKKKIKDQLGKSKPKPLQITSSGRFLTRHRTHTIKLNLQFMYA